MLLADVRTMAMVLFLVKLIQVPLFAYVWRVHRNFPPARIWAISTAVLGTGYILAGARNVLSDFLSIIVCNFMILSGQMGLDIGTLRALGVRISLRQAAPLALINIVLMLYYTYIEASASQRIIVYSCFVSISHLCTLWVCLRRNDRELHSLLNALAGVQAVTILAHCARAFHASEVQDLMQSTPVQSLWGSTMVFVSFSNCVLYILLADHHLQQQLEQAKRDADRASLAKSAFLTTMSHELRTPLNGILGFAQILLRDASLASPQRDSVETIQRSGEHLLGMINDILDLAKAEAGKLEVVNEPFNPAALLATLLESVQERSRQAGVIIDHPRGSLPLQVVGDARRLRQVLQQLIGIALSSSQPATVRLSARATNEGVSFALEDPRPAPLAQELELGLAVSRQLVTLMGGELRVECGEGGMRIHFELPLPCLTDPHSPDRVRRSGYEGQARIILVVDDILENRLLVRSMLEPLGFLVEEASDGPSLLARSAIPDLLLLDLVMEPIDGLTCLTQLRTLPEHRNWDAVPILMISASAFAEEQRRCREAGCQGFLAKPLDCERLLDEIGHHLQLRWNAPPVRQEPLCIELTAPLRERLEEACLLGDLTAVDAALEQLAQHDPSSAPKLRALADRFDFDAILNAIQAQEESPC